MSNLATGKIEDFHIKILSPYHFDANHHNPLDAAIVDTQSYIIEAIKDHIFEGARNKTNLKFLVKWAGSHDETWEYYKNVSKVQLVHTYLMQHNLKNFIPQIFQDANSTKIQRTRKRKSLIREGWAIREKATWSIG